MPKTMLKKSKEAILSKVGVVFSNLGTPASATANDVGLYLSEFLMDPYVIQMPSFFRFMLVRGIIVPFRRSKSAANYQKVWTENGSPLLHETNKAAQALQQTLGADFQVEVAMRYGQPNFAQCYQKLKDCESFVFFPQYPQYAESTVRTGLDAYFKYFPRQQTRVVEPYYEHPAFLKAYGDFLKEHLSALSFDHLLMSFHGLPESHLRKTDPSDGHCLQNKDCCQKAKADVLASCYRAQCYRSARGIAQAAGLNADQYSVSFQSRLGRQKWIEPYTEQRYGELLSRGVKKLAVICPGFSVDGLETLEEIAIAGKSSFMAQGGESFSYIPCLNDDSRWIQACAELVRNT